jgi:hypothetical protein
MLLNCFIQKHKEIASNTETKYKTLKKKIDYHNQQQAKPTNHKRVHYKTLAKQ